MDRGSWGLETLLLLLTYKWLLPSNVFLLRGNHEASYCTAHYGASHIVAFSAVLRRAETALHVLGMWLLICADAVCLCAWLL